MSYGPVSILESRWWSKGNHSVRSLFEAVATIHYENPSAFFYDMFANKSSLGTILNDRGTDNATEVLYLATHGNETEIGPNAANSISRTEFRNLIVSANAGGQIKGLYLGTCLTGNASTAKFLLENKNTKLDWVAGYRESVDWIDGSAIDMVFFHKLAELYVKNKSKRKGKLSARAIAHEAATQLNKIIPGAHHTYGFNIYFHEKNKLTSMFT